MGPTPHELALQLQQQFDNRVHFSPLLADGKPLNLEQAYAVQEQLVQIRMARLHARRAGLKIALNAPAAWSRLGLSEPVYGQLLDTALLPSDAVLSMGDYTHMKFEFEVAVRIGKTLSGDDLPSVQAAADWIDAVAPAVEVLDDRCPEKTPPDAQTLVACNVNNTSVILGPWQPAVADFDRNITITAHGTVIEEGNVAEIVNPLESVYWLAKVMARQQRSIPAGAVLITGNLMTVRFPDAGDQFTFALEGLGSVSFRCTA
ncbi:2-keto-4-pentenoate hydratase [Advenella mimigardefordensis]|uniref:Putative hydratase n=1 Tax=Advenella mimigardefordensis (strain DSM 17166 / LMG 22922 / DPN7) TaxID=1247726 RepID=W0P7B1_ADVMD|nr:fumarylacetoacetate hydrolase family protein [Advenella mimigardefordensis]AHG62724.1 putative hydratase [Advenella mimigardefordensis DPN7]